MPGKLITVAEAAALLHVTPRTVRNWIKKGKINAVKVAGTSIRVDLDEVARVVKPIVKEEN